MFSEYMYVHLNEYTCNTRSISMSIHAVPGPSQWVYMQHQVHLNEYTCSTRSISMSVHAVPGPSQWVYMQYQVHLNEYTCSTCIYIYKLFKTLFPSLVFKCLVILIVVKVYIVFNNCVYLMVTALKTISTIPNINVIWRLSLFYCTDVASCYFRPCLVASCYFWPCLVASCYFRPCL